HIVATAFYDRFGHAAMTVQRVGRYHTASELQKLDQLHGTGGLVVVRCQDIGERHPRLRRPGRHHDRRHVALAALVATPERLAVERADAAWPLYFRARRQGFHETSVRCLVLLRFEYTAYTSEFVVV